MSFEIASALQAHARSLQIHLPRLCHLAVLSRVQYSSRTNQPSLCVPPACACAALHALLSLSDKVQQRGQCGQQSHGREHHYGDQNHHLFGLYAEKFAAAPFEFTFADITFLQYPIHPIHERRSQAAAIALVRTVIHERVQRGERALAGCRGCHSCTRRVWMVLVVRADLARFMAIHERTQGRV